MELDKKINNLEIAYRTIRERYVAELWTEEQLRGIDERFKKMKSDLLNQ